MSLLLAAGLWLLGPGNGWGADTAYDLLGRLLTPFASVLLEKPSSGNHAMSLAWTIVESKGFAADNSGGHGELDLEYPDKLRMHAPILGTNYTICRRGTTLWVSPGSKLRALLERPEVAAKLPAPRREYQLKPFRVPVPEKLLTLLPVLFRAQMRPPETVAGQACQTMDLELTPLLGTAVRMEKWNGRAWVNGKEQLVQMRVSGPDTSMLLRFEKVSFAPRLPPETWVPTAEEGADAVMVPPARYDQLLRAITGVK